MEKLPRKILYRTKKKRNMYCFDAGLHTLGMKMKSGELDMDFVERFLVKFFKGCRNRGGKKYSDYFMWHGKGDNYITVWSVKL